MYPFWGSDRFTVGWVFSPTYLTLFIKPMNETNIPKLHEVQVDFNENTDGLVIEKTQELPDWWLQSLKDERFESKHRRSNEFHRAASIPAALHELWLSQGYDCTKEPIRKTLAKLKAENLDAFITSDKAF